MSNSAYQRSMEDMRKAGLNPILAYKTGGASTPSGASPPQAVNLANSALGAAEKYATTKNILEQNNNLQSNSALQRQQTAQAIQTTRRTKLENDAFSTIPPQLRAVLLAGNSAAVPAVAGWQLKNHLESNPSPRGSHGGVQGGLFGAIKRRSQK